ncbi:hypothetical protein GCT19_09510 [Paraburkholderia sp. CNPSo 3155]|uniref:hypothetical protein n=1 Tax=Paraburkholderia atlantica TaxID=2654982 RepID=UPI00128DB91C|nr:hypothetical protein [Paraburkholderia atlantica]MPW05880.1 hypothetical protein [Paraburkholderia atlantica]
MSKPDGQFQWMRTLAELRAELDASGDSFTREVIDLECGAAKEQARAAGWSGEFHDEPRVFVVPNSDTMQFGLIWTQPDDKLTTFVASPQPLPWLD